MQHAGGLLGNALEISVFGREDRHRTGQKGLPTYDTVSMEAQRAMQGGLRTGWRFRGPELRQKCWAFAPVCRSVIACRFPHPGNEVGGADNHLPVTARCLVISPLFLQGDLGGT